MQKVSELKYERLSMEEFAQEIKEVIHQVKTADSARAVLAARDRCNQLMIRWETAQALSYMRYSINTADAFYLVLVFLAVKRTGTVHQVTSGFERVPNVRQDGPLSFYAVRHRFG